jgi:hypothetical protein
MLGTAFGSDNVRRSPRPAIAMCEVHILAPDLAPPGLAGAERREESSP